MANPFHKGDDAAAAMASSSSPEDRDPTVCGLLRLPLPLLKYLLINGLGGGYSASAGLSGAGAGAGPGEETVGWNVQGNKKGGHSLLKASDVGSLMCTCSSMRSLADDDEEFAHLLLTKHLGPVKPLLRRILNEEEHEIAPNTYSYDARLIWATAYAKRNDELIHGEEKQRNESIDECAVHPRNHNFFSTSGGLCMFSEGPRGGLQEEEADPEGWKKKEEKWDAEKAEQIQGYERCRVVPRGGEAAGLRRRRLARCGGRDKRQRLP